MRKSSIYIISAIFLLIVANIAANYVEKSIVESRQLPEKIEKSHGFQRWITNHKKRMEISADDFLLKDENEAFAATFVKVTNLEDQTQIEEHIDYIATFEDIEDVEISPDERGIIDYRHEQRNGYDPHEAQFYGLRDEKLIDARILSCIPEANCYLDRAFFIENNLFVISEISRADVTRKSVESDEYSKCGEEELCTYSFKLHLIDLLKNTRTVYESKSFENILTTMVEFF